MAETTTTTWYQLSKFSSMRGVITPVEVLKETEHQLVIKTQYGMRGTKRVSKVGSYEWYFQTWQEAKDYCVTQAARELEVAANRLSMATQRLKEAQEIQP